MPRCTYLTGTQRSAHRPIARVTSVTTVLVMCLAARALAQRGVEWDASVGVRYGGLWQTGARVSDTFEEWVRVGLGGAIVDRRLLTYTLSITPRWHQARIPSRDSSGVNATFVGWNASVALFNNGQPVAAAVRTSRGVSSRRDFLGSRRDIKDFFLRGQVDFRIRALPAELFYERSTTSRQESFVDQSYASESWGQRVGFRAQNSKTSLRVEHNRFGDGVPDAALSEWLAGARHHHAWGRGSLWTSELDWIKRESRSRFLWREAGSIHHGSRVKSRLGFSLTSVRTPNGSQGIRDVHAGANTALPGQVSWGVNGRSRWSASEALNEHSLDVGSSVGTSRTLSRTVRFSASASLSYFRARQSPSNGGFVEVFRELHTIEPAGTFLLANPRVDPLSVRMANADGTLLYREGLDYAQSAVGMYVQITILPGGRLQLGDEVLVDYRYQAAVYGDRNQWITTVRATGNAGPVAVYGRLYRTRPIGTPDSVALGIIPYLAPVVDEYEAGISAGSGLPFGSASVNASWYRRDDEFGLFETTQLGASYAASVPHGPYVSAYGSIGWASGLASTRRTFVVGARADWQLSRTLQVRAQAGRWESRGGEVTNVVLTRSADLRWTPGRTALNIGYARDARTANGHQAGTAQDRLFLSLERVF